MTTGFDIDNDEKGGEATEPTPRMLSWAKNSALYRLSRKMMTEQELSRAIARKAKQKFEEISAAQVTALSAHAVEFGRSMLALNDTAYAEIRTRSSVASGRSKRVIAQKLAEKGVAKDIIVETLAETDDLRAAIIFARKRAVGPFRRDPDASLDDAAANKALAAFARQGFGFDLARRVLAMEREEAEELLAAIP